MGGGIAFIILGVLFGWTVGCIPFFTLATLLRPRWHFARRFLIGLALSTGAIIAVIWASAGLHNGRLFALYLVIMLMASVAGAFLLVVRWIFQKRASDGTLQ